MNRWLVSLGEKKDRLDGYRPLSSDLVKNLEAWFKIELTYTSNAIEGNTLSRAETALVVEKGLTVDGKTLQEHLEAINHAEAVGWIVRLARLKRREITQRHVLDLHRMILQKIDGANAGRYRTVSVRIAGSTVTLPNAAKVPSLMAEFIDWLHTVKNNELIVAAEAHFRLVSIHPFVDGNGRTARLLMNLLLMQAGYPPAIIRKEDRKHYIGSIEAGQLGKSLGDHYDLIFASVDRSLDIYLDAIEQKKEVAKITDKPLLKIGELAKLTGETVPTIRYWTSTGLLAIAGHSPGGYQLYSQDQAGRIKKIRQLQNQERLTISEIKKRLLS